MNRKLLGVSLAAVLAVAIAPAYAIVVEDYFLIDNAEARVKDHPNGKDLGQKVEINTVGDIPVNGEDLLGYGVFLGGGNTTAIVATSHAGAPFADSELQSDANDPIWHNHFVILDTESTFCTSGIHVVDLSYISHGTTKIDGTEVKLTNIPNNSNLASSSGLDGGATPIWFNTGTLSDTAVSFGLSVENSHVCVNPMDLSDASD